METPDEFLERAGLRNILQHVYMGVCKERPDDINSFIIDHLTVSITHLHLASLVTCCLLPHRTFTARVQRDPWRIGPEC